MPGSTGGLHVFANLLHPIVPHSFLCLSSNGYTVFGDEEVLAKFGVKPASLPDLFGLVGDVADNIPGEKH